MAINPIIAGLGHGSDSDSARPNGGAGFANALAEMMQAVNSDQVVAADRMHKLVVAGEGSIHDAMVAMANAEASFKLAMEVRNRLVDGVNRLLQSQGG